MKCLFMRILQQLKYDILGQFKEAGFSTRRLYIVIIVQISKAVLWVLKEGACGLFMR